MRQKKKIVAIVGPTASGKTELSIKIAQKFNGEIICADSRTIYKGMDIGTAKPSLDQQKLIHHYGLDIVLPNKKYSVAKFKIMAEKAVSEIQTKNKLPIIVGGSGLYIDSYLYNFDLNKPNARNIDGNLSLNALQGLAKKYKLFPSEQTMKNKQHLIRYIERNGVSSRSETTEALVIGIEVGKTTLFSRIDQRASDIFGESLIKETEKIIELYGDDAPGLNSTGYKTVVSCLSGNLSFDQAFEEFKKSHRHLAKKQLTWLKRNKDIVWVKDLDNIEQIINDYLLQ